MTLILIGYVPKIIVRQPDWFKDVPVVEEICSVSDCISKTPPDWITKWKHNKMFAYDTPELAWSIVPQEDRHRYTLFAYRVLPRLFDEKEELDWQIPNVAVSALPEGFSSIGFDVVSRFCGSDFECSPLSCNLMAVHYPVNKYCLVNNLETALAMARDFAAEQCEPGPYCVVEVLRQFSNEHRD